MEEAPSKCDVRAGDKVCLFRQETGLHKYLKERHPGLSSVDIAKDSNFVVLSGSPEAVQQACLEVKRILNEWQEQQIKISPDVKAELSPKNWNALQKAHKETGAWVFCRQQTLIVLGKCSESVIELTAIVDTRHEEAAGKIRFLACRVFRR